MIEEEMLSSLSGTAIYLASIGILIGATETGYRIGRRAQSRIDEKARSQVATIQAAVLGLLALLLGFTFAMSVSRYDMRKQLVLEESNAIGTTFLRTRLLPGPQGEKAAGLLRQYVDARLEFYEAGVHRPSLQAAMKRAGRLQKELWSCAVSAGRADPRAVTTGLYIQSLNELVDLDAKRVTALENHVPESVIHLVYLVAALAMGLTGYSCGLVGHRNLLPTVIASILIASVVLLIVDLDRPRRGLIRVSQQSMVRLRESIRPGSR